MVRLQKPLEYFQLFYSDNVFAKIADFTNANARNKYNLVDFRIAHGAMYLCRPACGERKKISNEFSPGHYLVRWVRVKFSIGVRVSGMIRVRVDVGVRVSNLLGSV